MNYFDYLSKIIEDGIEAVKIDYASSRHAQHLEGSLAAFNECRNKDPKQLSKVLESAQKRTHCARLEEAENYWWIRCFELEVEWVCNCVSVMLSNEGLAVIVPPTYRAFKKAAQILGAR